MSGASLAALRLADSALPVGTDSVSYGLEQFVERGDVDDAESLRRLLETYLRRQLGPGDLVALRAARAGIAGEDVERVVTADRRLSAVTLAAEFRDSSTRTGERLLTLQRDLADDPVLDAYADRVGNGAAPGNYAAVLGAVCEREGIAADDACRVACHEFVTGLLGAAQRLLGIGHTAVQRTHDDLRPAMTAAVDASADRRLEEMDPYAPLVDIASAEHERADRRLFLS